MCYVSSLKVGSPSSWIFLIIYPLVNKHSYGKLPFIVDFPIKHGDFPEGIPIHEGQYNHVLGSMHNPSPAHFCEAKMGCRQVLPLLRTAACQGRCPERQEGFSVGPLAELVRKPLDAIRNWENRRNPEKSIWVVVWKHRIL